MGHEAWSMPDPSELRRAEAAIEQACRQKMSEEEADAQRARQREQIEKYVRPMPPWSNRRLTAKEMIHQCELEGAVEEEVKRQLGGLIISVRWSNLLNEGILYISRNGHAAEIRLNATTFAEVSQMGFEVKT